MLKSLVDERCSLHPGNLSKCVLGNASPSSCICLLAAQWMTGRRCSVLACPRVIMCCVVQSILFEMRIPPSTEH